MMIALLIAIILVIVTIYIYHTYSTVTTSSIVTNTLMYNNIAIYKGTNKPIFTSDGIEHIIYSGLDGTYMYKIEDQKLIKVSNIIPIGLAYDGTYFMMLDSDQTLYQIGQDGTVTSIETGYTELYDTIDGYYIGTINSFSVTGDSASTAKNTGNYGLILLKVK